MPRTEDYNIREAVEEDVIDLTILGKQFLKETKNDRFLGWNSTKAHNFFLDAANREDFGVFVLCNGNEIVGMFVCFATPCFFSDAVQAVEIVWYVDPEHRGSKEALKLLDVYEEWARKHGAVCANLMNVDILKGAKVAKLYGRKGYTLTENTFVKEL
ncbi:MAG: GNAT family N-acetyltransferase [Candidatus Thorarchaeota archaeon]|jgi:GNAT superfamily N-acetyltransferase